MFHIAKEEDGASERTKEELARLIAVARREVMDEADIQSHLRSIVASEDYQSLGSYDRGRLHGYWNASARDLGVSWEDIQD